MPNITVIMNTNGATPRLIEEAIYSVLNQTYQNFKLLIVCIHPDGLTLDKHHPNIEIMNIKPFSKFPEQIYFAINQVKTPYWCIVDSDDYIRPTHLENLMSGVLEYGSQDTFAIGAGSIIAQHQDNIVNVINKGWHRFAYGAKHAIYMDGNNISSLVHNGWWRMAFSELDVKILQNLLIRHETEHGFDSVVLEKMPWIRLEQNYEPTYLYRYGVSYHVSMSQDKVHPNNPLPILKPQLYDDYEIKIKKYLKRYNFNGQIIERNNYDSNKK